MYHEKLVAPLIATPNDRYAIERRHCDTKKERKEAR
jgi:hypothetical protein